MQAKNVMGTTASVDGMSMEELKRCITVNISPSVCDNECGGCLPKQEYEFS
jgi:hypothetical protein